MDVTLVIENGSCSIFCLLWAKWDLIPLGYIWNNLLSSGAGFAPQGKDWDDKICKDKGFATPKTFRACFVPGSVRNALQLLGPSHSLCVLVALKGWGRMASQVHSDKQIYNHSVARKVVFFWFFGFLCCQMAL